MVWSLLALMAHFVEGDTDPMGPNARRAGSSMDFKFREELQLSVVLMIERTNIAKSVYI
jgi:hypothetical protein